MSDPQPDNRHTRRDGESLMVLGGFMVVLAIPVIIGTFFAGRAAAAIVNVIAGAVLLAIGIGFVVQGIRTVRRAPGR